MGFLMFLCLPLALTSEKERRRSFSFFMYGASFLVSLFCFLCILCTVCKTQCLGTMVGPSKVCFD